MIVDVFSKHYSQTLFALKLVVTYFESNGYKTGVMIYSRDVMIYSRDVMIYSRDVMIYGLWILNFTSFFYMSVQIFLNVNDVLQSSQCSAMH